MEDAILCSTKNETGKRGKGMKLKKAICAGLSLAMVATSLAMPMGVQAAEGTDEEITLTVHIHYSDESGKELADYAAEKVKEKYPNVTLEFEDFIGDGGQTLKTRAATGDLPDIIKLDGGTINALAASGNLLTLDDYYEETNYTDHLPQNVIDNSLYSSDGHIYQFPIDGIAPVLWYYNKQIFEENNIKVPTNYDELMTAIEQLQALDIIPVAMFGKEPWPVGAFFDTFAVKENAGGLKALSLGEAKASDEGYTKAINKIADAVEAGIFQEGVTNTDSDTAIAMFEEGQAAMILNGSWYLTTAMEALGEDNVDFLDTYPTGDGEESEEVMNRMAGGPDTAGVGVAASTEYPEIAIDVAAIFAQAREELEYSKYHLLTAPVKTDEIEIEGELAPVQEKLLSKVPEYTYGSQFVHTLANTKFSADMIEELQKLLVGESAEEFIANVDESIEKTVE